MREQLETLFYACAAGDLDRVKQILAAGDHDINGKNCWMTDMDPRGWQRSPLFMAISGGHLELAQWLLENGANVNQQTKYGDTPLNAMLGTPKPAHWFEATELLLAHGADPMIPNADGDTSIDNARKSPVIWEKVKDLFAKYAA